MEQAKQKIRKPAENINAYHDHENYCGAPLARTGSSYVLPKRRRVVLLDYSQLFSQNKKYCDVAKDHCYKWYQEE